MITKVKGSVHFTLIALFNKLQAKTYPAKHNAIIQIGNKCNYFLLTTKANLIQITEVRTWNDTFGIAQVCTG